MPFDLADLIAVLGLSALLTVCILVGNRILARVDRWVEEDVKPAIQRRLDS